MKKNYSMVFSTILFLVLSLTSHSVFSQNVAKTITFNSVTVAAGSSYIGADPNGGDNEDFAVLVKCTNNSLLFAGDWTATADVTAAGTYNFGTIYSDCNPSTFVLEPIDPATNSITFNIETFESGDLDCDGPYNPRGIADDQFQEISNGVSFDISLGSHSFTQTTTGITYNYTVTSAASANTGLICGVDYKVQLPPPSLPITFEDEATIDYGIGDFAGNSSTIVSDPTDPTNTVLRTEKESGALLFAGTVIGVNGLASAIPFSATQTKMTVRVWSPNANTPILLKVEDFNNPVISSELQVNTTLVGQWETLEFDFTNGNPALNLANTYDKVLIFFDRGTVGTGEIYYCDDVEFVVTPTMAQCPIPDISANRGEALPVGQTFTACSSGIIDAVIVDIHSCGGGSNDFTLEAGTGTPETPITTPTSTVITFPCATGLQTFNFNPPLAVTEGEQYYFKFSGNHGMNVSANLDPSTYTGGSLYFFSADPFLPPPAGIWSSFGNMNFKLISSEPTVSNDADINDPCACNLDGSGLANGTFAETVTVNGNANNETWRVTAVSALNPGGAAPTGIAVNDVLTLVAGSNDYEITFDHSDLDGYNMTVERSSDNFTLMISNVCATPTIAFNPAIPTNPTGADPTITLGANLTNMGTAGAGFPNYTLDGTNFITALDFDNTITDLANGIVSPTPGNYTLTARYETDGSGSGMGGTLAAPAVPTNACPVEATASFMATPVPTLGQWGLIVLSLLLLNLGFVALAAPKLATTTGQQIPQFSLNNLPFDLNQYAKMWAGTVVSMLAIFTIAIQGFGYELTSADPIGAVVSSFLVAYLVFLVKNDGKK